ncbi:MAG TPA: lactate utilization protein [Patescibacteria group bacterium]|nr:lactate utilization protein [Patescibacteria group bacterium]
MNEFRNWHNDVLGAKVVEALQKNNFSATYVKNRQEAADQILAMVPAEAVVGMGGSWTMGEIGIEGLLEKRGHRILNHNKPGLTPEEVAACRQQQLTCDVFLSGTNAVTVDGQLVNVDGVGNRVAAMIYGPKKVIIAVGANKLVSDCEAAVRRIEMIAAPINNKRLNRPNPCVVAGECMNCQGPTRICNVTTIMHKKPALTDIHVLIIGEELGF